MFLFIWAVLETVVVSYPAYKTYKALESQSVRVQHAMLAYWCCHALLHGVDVFLTRVVDDAFPYYVFFKATATFYLLKIVGPEALYDQLVKPYFDRVATDIDAAVHRAEVAALKTLHELELQTLATAEKLKQHKGTQKLVHTLQRQRERLRARRQRFVKLVKSTSSHAANAISGLEKKALRKLHLIRQDSERVDLVSIGDSDSEEESSE